MRKLVVVLFISLMVNVAAIGGYVYERFWRLPQMQLQHLAQTLQLTDKQAEALRELRESSRSYVKDTVKSLEPRIAEGAKWMQDGKADDPGLEKAFREFGEIRLQIQMHIIRKIIAFRDTLNPQQREIYNRLAKQPAFFKKLVGLETD